MKKLLVLALLGLLLGAGAWKVQNPDGTISDARTQAAQLGERLKSGVQAVRLSDGSGVESQQDLQERLSRLEESMVADDNDLLPETVDELAEAAQDAEAGNAANSVRLDAIDKQLEQLAQRLDDLTVDEDLQRVQESIDTLGQDVSALRDANSSSETAINSELSAVKEQIAALDLRLDTLSADQSAAPSGSIDNTDTGSASLAASLDERFKALETRLTTVNTDSRQIATLTEQLEAAREEISQLKESTASNQRSVDRLDGSVTELRSAEETPSSDTAQDDVSEQLTLLQSQIASLEQRLQAVDTAGAGSSGSANAGPSGNPLASDNFVTPDDLADRAELQAVQYKIYFDYNSVDITPDAAKVLDSFITQEQNRTTGVAIYGFTDPLGAAIYNQQLALQRATNVRSYLIRNGFDFSRIKAINGLGEEAAAAVLPENASASEQRVVVLYASQP